LAAAPWRIAFASAIGTSHLGTGVPCQDSAAFELLETNEGCVLVAVVCDGAGSAAYADIGSQLATRTLLDLVKTFFKDGGLLRTVTRDIALPWTETVAKALEGTAEDAGHAVRDYACTLLLALVGENSNAFIQIGDGAIVVSEGEQDGWAWVFWPQHGEFANTTNFVVSANATEVMEFAATSTRIDEVALFSDGIENLVLQHSTKTVHDAFFDAMFPPVRKAAPGLDEGLSQGLERYLSSPLICDKTDDDKTLILATRRSEAPAAEATDESAA
jgi:hypothetical protein